MMLLEHAPFHLQEYPECYLIVLLIDEQAER